MRVVATASATAAVIPAVTAASATATVVPAVTAASAVPAVDKPVAPCVTGSVTLALATATSVAGIGEKVIERVSEFA